MEIPNGNNVYGLLICNDLEQLANDIQSNLEATSKQVSIYQSQFDGVKTLKVYAQEFEFETTKLDNFEYLFNGAVAGNDSQIKHFVFSLYNEIKKSGYVSSFEIYDSKHNCIEIIK